VYEASSFAKPPNAMTFRDYLGAALIIAVICAVLCFLCVS